MKQFILVAGHEYQHWAYDFAVFCRRRIQRLQRVHAGENLRFFLIAFRQGVVETYDVPARGARSTLSPTVERRFNNVTTDNYLSFDYGGRTETGIFNNNQQGVASVLDVYQLIQNIGDSTDAGSLVELTFFSHAWMGGPILLNSIRGLRLNRSHNPPMGYIDSAFQSVSNRDPLDHDPRFLDFESPNMSPEQLQHFRNAFHEEGYIRSWGCLVTASYQQVLEQLVRSSRYRERGLGDGVSFRFRFTPDQANFFYSWDNFFPEETVELTFERSFGEIKDFFHRGHLGTFSSVIATAANRTTYAALLGTAANLRAETMFINTRRFGSHIRFYQNYLGVLRDPERLGYGGYVPDVD